LVTSFGVVWVVSFHIVVLRVVVSSMIHLVSWCGRVWWLDRYGGRMHTEETYE
jgi:hypothetical protein